MGALAIVFALVAIAMIIDGAIGPGKALAIAAIGVGAIAALMDTARR